MKTAKKLLSLFNFYLYEPHSGSPLVIFDLDCLNSFIDSLMLTPSVSLLVIPSAFKNVSLQHLLPKKVTRVLPMLETDSLPKWVLTKGRQGFDQYDPSKMLTTQVLLPFPEFKEALRVSQDENTNKNSNQIDLLKIYENFEHINSNQDGIVAKISSNLFELVDPNPAEDEYVSLLVKVYNPKLNLVYNHSVHRVSGESQFSDLWKLITKSVSLNEFYLFLEGSPDEKNFINSKNVPGIQMIESPIELQSKNYWELIDKTLGNRLEISLKSGETSQMKVQDILVDSLSAVHSFIVVPGIQSINSELERIKFKVDNSAKLSRVSHTDSQDTRKIENVLHPENFNARKLSNPNSGSINPIDESFNIDKSLSTIQRFNKDSNDSNLVGTGSTPDKNENIFQSREQKILKKMNTSKEVIDVSYNASKEFTQSLLYLDMSILLCFLNLYRKFTNLFYFENTDSESKVSRSLLGEENMTDKDFYSMLYEKFYNEKDFLQNLKRNKSGQDLYLNGHFCYGNDSLDKYSNSLPSEHSNDISSKVPILHGIKGNSNI